MRTKDEEKQAALFEATVKVVNQVGFAASSVSKIAKEAGVSPATLYVYHENKDELLISTYVEVKRMMSEAILKDFDETRPIRDILKTVWLNLCGFGSNHLDYFIFTEQFANSPFVLRCDHERLQKFFKPLHQVLTRGIEQKIIKDVDQDMMNAFMYVPIIYLAKTRAARGMELTEQDLDVAFGMCWDAIKL